MDYMSVESRLKMMEYWSRIRSLSETREDATYLGSLTAVGEAPFRH
jgi:hypothetical protein